MESNVYTFHFAWKLYIFEIVGSFVRATPGLGMGGGNGVSVQTCAGHTRYLPSAPTAMLVLVLVLLLLIGVSVCSVSSFSCSTISHLRWTRCSFAQVSALGVLDICSFSIFNFFLKKELQSMYGSQFNQQRRENSPETSKNTPNRTCRADTFVSRLGRWDMAQGRGMNLS